MNWKLVHVANGDAEAMVARSFLESQGIEVREAKESAGDLYAVNVDGMGEVKLFVPEGKFEQARKLLEEMQAV